MITAAGSLTKSRRLLVAALLALGFVPVAAAPAHADAPSLAISDLTAWESTVSGTTRRATFHVYLSRANDETVTVDYLADPGTSGDFELASGTLAFAPGETDKTFSVYVRGDGVYEPPETYDVVLSNPVNAEIADGVGTLTIRNVDPDGGWGCQAGAVIARAAGTQAGHLIANPGSGLPCRFDRHVVDESGEFGVPDSWEVGPVWVGYGLFNVRTDGVKAGAVDASSVAYLNRQTVDYIAVRGLLSRASWVCTTDSEPVPSAYSDLGLVARMNMDGVTMVILDDPVNVLPSGTIVALNRTVIEDIVGPDGRPGKRLRVQPVVITNPLGAEVVIGEATSIYYGNPCRV